MSASFVGAIKMLLNWNHEAGEAEEEKEEEEEEAEKAEKEKEEAVCLSVRPFVRPSVCPFICLSVRLSVRFPVRFFRPSAIKSIKQSINVGTFHESDVEN